jgi:hypothetical protein
MSKSYLKTTAYNVGNYKSMTNGTQYFGLQFSASFSQPDSRGRFVTLTFTLNTDGRYAGSDGVREGMHSSDDQVFLKHRIKDERGTEDALGRFKTPTGGSVAVQATSDDSAAWWRACTPYDGNNFVVYYGVIDHGKIRKRAIAAAKRS